MHRKKKDPDRRSSSTTACVWASSLSLNLLNSHWIHCHTVSKDIPYTSFYTTGFLSGGINYTNPLTDQSSNKNTYPGKEKYPGKMKTAPYKFRK
ncbi:hypothetical protein H8356DRAFT_1344636 [Neocallimastix lanati (nom. inval.)]|nr:hypothetical protein H8356DRAFT_1344636 [Neocallimastix sp. JGI-2020a]